MAFRVGEILVQKKLISWEQLEEALEYQKKSKILLGEILVTKQFVTKRFLYQALAEQSHLKFVDLPSTQISQRALEKLPQPAAKKHGVIPIELQADTLYLGISNPLNIWPETEIRSLTGMEKIKTVLCLPEDIEDAIEEEYGKAEAAFTNSKH